MKMVPCTLIIIILGYNCYICHTITSVQHARVSHFSLNIYLLNLENTIPHECRCMKEIHSLSMLSLKNFEKFDKWCLMLIKHSFVQ